MKSITAKTCKPKVKNSHTLYSDLWIKAFVNKSQYHVIKIVAELEMEFTIQLEVIATKPMHVFLWLYHRFQEQILHGLLAPLSIRRDFGN